MTKAASFRLRLKASASSSQPKVASPELLAALSYLSSQQRPEGCVAGEVVWSPIITAQYALVAFMTGQAIPDERRERFLQHFRVTRRLDGGWALHPEGPSLVFVTALVYVALRVLGLSAGDPLCAQARTWLRAYGGVEHIPSWGKLWLAMLNLYGYDGINPILPELWLLPARFPLSPAQLYCHTRLIYLGFSYLYGARFQTPANGLVVELREELYRRPFEEINFGQYRNALAASDIYQRPGWLLQRSFDVLAGYERHTLRALRHVALQEALRLIVLHAHETNFVSLSPVNGLLNILALWHAGRPEFGQAFRAVDYWAWHDEAEGERFVGANSHSWDTAFSVQAICEGPARDQMNEFLAEARRYFEVSQMRHDPAPEPKLQQAPRIGGFCFSDRTHKWPVSDCTAESLSALSYVGAGQVDVAAAVQFILSRQNADGGWGSFERRRGSMLLERSNLAEMFGGCMVEHSYVECTGSCLQGLRHALEAFCHSERSEESVLPGRMLQRLQHDKGGFQQIEAAIRSGTRLLRKQQLADGSWEGFWGIHHIYGTMFGVIGLLAGGAASDGPAIVRACRWLVKARLPDGGWGEDWRGVIEGKSTPASRSQVIQTAWALITLLKAGYDGPGAAEAIEGGVAHLRYTQLSGGNWPEQQVAGVFFQTAMLHYRLYKSYFPIWALGLYERSR